MLDVLSNMVVVPQTPIQELNNQGEMMVSLPQANLSSMQVSVDGQFLAFIQDNGQGASGTLKVLDLKQDMGQLVSQSIQGQQLAWLGASDDLVYEDHGDIFRLNLPDATSRNLTASDEYDSKPLPSPNGKSVMWTRRPAGGGEAEDEFWLVDSDGGNKRFLAAAAKLPVWDPSGDKILSRRDIVISPSNNTYSYFLETANDNGSGWGLYAKCDREPLYAWWPGDSFYYVASYKKGGGADTKGVWFRVDGPTSFKRVAATASLGADTSYYRFYPSRKGQLLAYVGEKGLEYLDMLERAIYRFNGVDARLPLAWDEASGYLYYSGETGIYRVSIRGGGS